MQVAKPTRNELIAIMSFVVAIIGSAAAVLVVPEFRSLFGLKPDLAESREAVPRFSASLESRDEQVRLFKFLLVHQRKVVEVDLGLSAKQAEFIEQHTGDAVSDASPYRTLSLINLDFEDCIDYVETTGHAGEREASACGAAFYIDLSKGQKDFSYDRGAQRIQAYLKILSVQWGGQGIRVIESEPVLIDSLN
jgi:hypothetical protein